MGTTGSKMGRKFEQKEKQQNGWKKKQRGKCMYMYIHVYRTYSISSIIIVFMILKFHCALVKL